MTIASIDIGTNTLRLLIGRVDTITGRIEESLLSREITRLGGGFDGVNIHEDAKKRTIETLRRFSESIRNAGASKVAASATSVVREARNGPAFIDEVLRETGISVQTISGEKEAALTIKGVLSALEGGRDNKALVFDIGGGSTEFIYSEKGLIKGLKSLNMGVVSITEKHLKSDPPSASDIEAMTAAIEGFLERYVSSLPPIPKDCILVGTAGTVTSLAALDQDLRTYDSRKINNYRMKKTSIGAIFKRLSSMTHSERAAIEALEEGRADLIIAGTIMVLKTLETFGFNEMVVSDYGLLEGLLLELAEKGSID